MNTFLSIFYCTLISITCVYVTPGDTTNEWKLLTQNERLKVYTRITTKSPIKEVKIVGTIAANRESLIKALNEVEKYKIWIYKCLESERLYEVNPDEYFYYTLTDLPFPLDDRDLVVHSRQWFDQEGNWISRSSALPTYIPECDHAVRVKMFESRWKIKSLGKKECHIDYFIGMDPGINLPPWIINLGITIGPIRTFEDLEKRSIELMKGG